MLSTTIKRSVATVGVVAGLLAAAGPASAQVMPGTMGFTTPDDAPPAAMRNYTTGIYGLTGGQSASTNFIEIGTTETLDLNRFGGNDTLRPTVTCLDQDMSTVKAPATPTANGFCVSFEHMDVKAPTNAGTQVGSEGSKAPAKTDGTTSARSSRSPLPTWTEANTQPSGGSYRQGATLGTQVGSEGVKDDEPLETVSFTFKGEVTGLEPG